MAQSHYILTAIAISAMRFAGVAYAQVPTPQPAPASPSISERLKAKMEQKEDKLEAKSKRKMQKLTNFLQQAKDQDLRGRKRWKFIAKCMI
jgi:cytochrome c1